MMTATCPRCGRVLRGRLAPLYCTCTGTPTPAEPTHAPDRIEPKPARVFSRPTEPAYIGDRIHTCAACPHRVGEDCGELKSRGKGCRLMGPRGIPHRAARCPLGRWLPVL